MKNPDCWDFKKKKDIVLKGKSKILNNWQTVSTVTTEEFLTALEWLCNDSLDDKGYMTREIGLLNNGIVKLKRCYTTNHETCAFYREDNGELWNGDVFNRLCLSEHEKKFSFDGKTISELHKISISCKDNI